VNSYEYLLDQSPLHLEIAEILEAKTLSILSSIIFHDKTSVGETVKEKLSNLEIDKDK
jgi:hypothetical protein